MSSASPRAEPISLMGQNILVTRPEQQGEALLNKLSRLGAKAIHYPVLALQPLALNDARRAAGKQLLLNLDQYHHVIFISTNAVSFGAELMQEYWPQWPVGLQWYAIGVATAKAMVAYGIEASAPTIAMNSEALLQLMDLQHIQQQKVLIVRGAGGREHLADQLRAKGALVDYLECYQRKLPTKPHGQLTAMIVQQAINIICVNSGESLENLLRLADEDCLLSCNLVVPGKRVADLALAVGFQHLIIADNASDDAYVAAIQHYVKIHQ